MLARKTAVLRDRTGVSEMMGSAFLLIFVVLVMATPLKNLGNTIANGYLRLNSELPSTLRSGGFLLHRPDLLPGHSQQYRSRS